MTWKVVLLIHFLLSIPFAIVINRAAKAKDMNVTAWTIMALIPVFNFCVLPFMISLIFSNNDS
jgi:hypothetical protein